MKNIEEKILMADEEIKQLQNKRKKLISQQKQEERKREIKGYMKKGQSLKVFSDLLNYELFKRGKRELVDVKQLITIDYIFLFYPYLFLSFYTLNILFL